MLKKIVNIADWIEENKNNFLPPVCNKLLHNDDLAIFFVGGPNKRFDYHIEEGEELFYMLKGDMCLKVIEQNEPRDIVIKEGEMFLLPSNIPHSPQRKKHTLGLVIERRRLSTELDGLLYFGKDIVTLPSSNIPEGPPKLLYEKYYPLKDIEKDVRIILNRFYESPEYTTGKCSAEVPPLGKGKIAYDVNAKLGDPLPLTEWITKHKNSLSLSPSVSMFDKESQMQVEFLGEVPHEISVETCATWIWVLQGEATIKHDSEDFTMKENDSLLIPANTKVMVEGQENTLVMKVHQDIKRKHFF